MSINPYESPVSPPDHQPPPSGVVPSYKLHTPGQVAWATFLGSPLAGSLLLAINYQRLGKSGNAMAAAGIGGVSTLGLIAAAISLPEQVPNPVLPVISVVVIWQLAKALQGAALEQHLASGGERASNWAATGIGLASVLFVLGLVVVAAILLPENWFPE